MNPQTVPGKPLHPHPQYKKNWNGRESSFLMLVIYAPPPPSQNLIIMSPLFSIDLFTNFMFIILTKVVPDNLKACLKFGDVATTNVCKVDSQVLKDHC